jgi:hypothetical protein
MARANGHFRGLKGHESIAQASAAASAWVYISNENRPEAEGAAEIVFRKYANSPSLSDASRDGLPTKCVKRPALPLRRRLRPEQAGTACLQVRKASRFTLRRRHPPEQAGTACLLCVASKASRLISSARATGK